jgi:hypothetical protein
MAYLDAVTEGLPLQPVHALVVVVDVLLRVPLD